MIRRLRATLLLAGLALPALPAQAGDRTPDCEYCKERLRTLEALRAALPAGWKLELEREPVFDGEVLVVQAGLEHPQTLLLVHGLGSNGFTDWMTVMPRLAQRYHVLALDLPGFGYSDSPEGRYSPHNYARVLSWLLQRHGKGPAIVAGHSMGGAASLRLASEYPAQLKKLVLVDAAGILQRSAFVKHRVGSPLAMDETPWFLKGAVARVKSLEHGAVEKFTSMPGPAQWLKSAGGAWGLLLSGHSGLNAGMSMIEEDFSAAVYTMQVPTQIIWGAKDDVAPPRTGQMLARRLSRAQLRTLPGVGHTPMEEPGTSAFQAMLDTALADDPQPADQAAPAGPATVDLRCKDRGGQTYAGHFREVRIENCAGTRLQDLSAESIVLRDSVVEMTNVQVRAKGVALEVVDSELVATAGELSGEVAVRADNSRIDMAGFVLESRGHAVEVRRSSRLLGSANRVVSPDYTGYWHGSVELEKAALAP